MLAFLPLYTGQAAFYLQCALRQRDEVSLDKIIKQHVYTPLQLTRGREKRGAEQRLLITSTKGSSIDASSGSSVTPADRAGDEGRRGKVYEMYMSSLLLKKRGGKKRGLSSLSLSPLRCTGLIVVV